MRRSSPETSSIQTCCMCRKPRHDLHRPSNRSLPRCPPPKARGLAEARGERCGTYHVRRRRPARYLARLVERYPERTILGDAGAHHHSVPRLEEAQRQPHLREWHGVKQKHVQWWLASPSPATIRRLCLALASAVPLFTQAVQPTHDTGLNA